MIELKRFLESKKISQAEFSRKTGIDKFQLSKFVNGVLALNKVSLDKIKAGYPDFNYNVEQLKIINPDPNGKQIPYYEGHAFATISQAMADVVALRPDTFIHIPMFSQGEFALQVTGHSMRPYISHGDFVVVKRIINRDAIIYDEPYMMVTKDDNLKTVKFVKEHKEKKKLWLVPYNIEQFNEQTILKEDILELYRVVGLFRTV